MIECRNFSRRVALLVLVAASGAWSPTARAQATAGSNTGLGLAPLPFNSGGGNSPAMGIIPMGTTGTGSATAGSRASDPLGIGYVYGGAAMPMTREQTGLYMLSASQRMLGVGNGQLSGVRPGGPAGQASKAGRTRTLRAPEGDEDPKAASTHRRDANVPGGLAAAYFNRPTGPAARANKPQRFNRPLRYFPQRGQ
ncbi:hypothetical protein [Aquisphaera insulae]|uniref:hypothetical protein n=1 Tax=Aquisphaera insulae TaxID=2712864 RepID=UPI0013EA5DA2|nr:hypothetical protein [Aquisphaera insulae]